MSGSSNVAIFFVVSGFSLSYKPLRLIRQGSYPAVLDSLGSSVTRRGVRLIMPPAFVTLFAMLSAYNDLYGVGPGARQPPMSPLFWGHIKSWFYDVMALSDPFRPQPYPGGYTPVYDTNLWTIPIELHGSMVIFTILLGVAKMRPRYRVGLLGITVLYLNYYAYSHLFLFMSGVLLCEIYHIRQANSTRVTLLPSSTSSFLAPILGQRFSNPVTILTTVLWAIYTYLSLHLLSMPMIDYGAATSPGYRFLAAHIPPRYRAPYIQDTFYIFQGAVHLVFIISAVPLLQRPFTTRFAQYLGRISFALYICHGTLLYTLGWNLNHWWLARLSGSDGELGNGGYGLAIVLTGLVLYPLLFWVSDLVARGVDAKSVQFARWTWEKASVKG